MLEIFKKNNISNNDILSGKIEAENFEKGNFNLISNSCEKKVESFYTIYNLFRRNELKVSFRYWIGRNKIISFIYTILGIGIIKKILSILNIIKVLKDLKIIN